MEDKLQALGEGNFVGRRPPMSTSVSLLNFDPSLEPESPLPVRSELAPELVQRQLERIINSGAFRRASRRRSLLQYIVGSALNGQENSEVRTAREWLGKSDDFDPALNPVIRVNLGRLRRTLSRYYAGEGRRDEVVIQIPNRRYSPAFAWQSTSDAVPQMMQPTSNGEYGSRVHEEQVEKAAAGAPSGSQSY
jgi:hypothetical protein